MACYAMLYNILYAAVYKPEFVFKRFKVVVDIDITVFLGQNHFKIVCYSCS